MFDCFVLFGVLLFRLDTNSSHVHGRQYVPHQLHTRDVGETFVMLWGGNVSHLLAWQRVVISIGAVVTAATGVKKRSRGQGLFSVSVKQSWTIFKLGNSGQDIYVLPVRIAHSVVKSNSQSPFCGTVKWSSNKNDSQNFLTPVAAVTTAPMGVTTPCMETKSPAS